MVPGFTAIHPFGKDNPLHPEVKSDHCEVSVLSSDGHIISAYNISNPAYHKYFANDANGVFAQTHLANTEPDFLARKVELQSKMLAERLLTSQVSIQIVVEGYETFFIDLQERLSSGSFHLLAEKPEGWSQTKNITGIIVDTSKFKVIESSVITVDYVDSENEGRRSVLRVPYVHLQNLVSKEGLVVAGVHVPGAASQYPKDGLAQLGIVLTTLWEKFKVDLVAMGDFNSTPDRVAPHVEGTVLEPDYFTHANPRFPAASKYDLAVVKSANASVYEVQPLSAVSEESQLLAKGLEANVIS